MVADWTAEVDEASDEFGFYVGTAGDMDGNGYADVIVGATGYDHDSDQSDEGNAFDWKVFSE